MARRFYVSDVARCMGVESDRVKWCYAGMGEFTCMVGITPLATDPALVNLVVVDWRA